MNNKTRTCCACLLGATAIAGLALAGRRRVIRGGWANGYLPVQYRATA